MALSNLDLPIDIPWKRLAATEDMFQKQIILSQYPPKWRSSISIYYYEPSQDELPDDIKELYETTFLKIVCTITGYQTSQGELERYFDFANLNPQSGWGVEVQELLTDLRKSYFPCFGSLIQISILPEPAEGVKLEDIDIKKYPYIVDFEPKKREMYESATETTEELSHSASGTHIQKGTTTVDETEFSASVGYTAGTKGGPGGKVEYKQKHSKTDIDMMTADSSREKRENYSFSTNISQMYTLFNGYHLGTNRAVFLVQPRPHMVDLEMSHFWGMRRLEGIQEILMIVHRPKSEKVVGVSVQATLETAHLAQVPKYIARAIPMSELFVDDNFEKTADFIWGSWNKRPDHVKSDKSIIDLNNMVSKWNKQHPWARHAMVASTLKGETPRQIQNIKKQMKSLAFLGSWVGFDHPFKTIAPWQLPYYSEFMQNCFGNTIKNKIAELAADLDAIKAMAQLIGMIPGLDMEELAIIFEIGYESRPCMIVTGRAIGGSTHSEKWYIPLSSKPQQDQNGEEPLDEWVAFEECMKKENGTSSNGGFVVIDPRDLANPRQTYNDIQGKIRDKLIGSIGSELRELPGKVHFLESMYIKRRVERTIPSLGPKDPENIKIGIIARTDQYIEFYLNRIKNLEQRKQVSNKTRAAVLKMSDTVIREIFDLKTDLEARNLRLTLCGISRKRFPAPPK